MREAHPVHASSPHVLDDDGDDDLLGGAETSDARSTMSMADSFLDDGLSRAGSTRKGASLFDAGDDEEYVDDVRLRPMGSSKTIVADDEAGAEAWIDQPVAARTRRARRASGSGARRASPHARAGAAAAGIVPMLLQDAAWQLRSLRHRTAQAVRRLRGEHAEDATRRVHVNDAEASAAEVGFNSNQVMTNKYNVVTFVPRFLVEQFSKYANLFFLFIGCLQQIPGVSPTNRWTTLVPLAIVLLASALKELSEDWRRYRADAEMNARIVHVLDAAAHGWQPRAWRDVRVGDVVRVERDDFFPADLVLLSSSEPEGLAYVETANLDGETNLKVKQAHAATAPLASAGAAAALRGTLTCEAPNNSLYTFDGTLDTGARTVPVGPDQLLLRGAQLRNAPWVYGLAVFTGHDTKLLRNATGTPLKRTRVEKQVNALILSLFVLLLALSVVSSIGAQIDASADGTHAQYLMPSLDTRSGARKFVESVLTFIILYNSLIPISLIVSMEFVKFQQASLINADLDMYHAPTDTPALCRRSNLVEDLGQVGYLFSDKTGTLTQNVMVFQQASVAGIAFAHAPGDLASDEAPTPWSELPALLAAGSAHAAALDEFLTVLAVCHTVIPERDGARVVFQASSPDEAALVAGAQSLGYEFTTRKPRSVYVSVAGEERAYEVLQVCEFNSTRKRMSTIVRQPSGKITLFCKGADAVVLPRLAPQQTCVDATLAHLEAYASDGLRTLCVAKRELDPARYAAWAKTYEAAAAAVTGRADALDAAAEEIEQELVLLGATAIEDKLQDGVPETIATLQEAGIRVWVLTGDRQETAVNIGYSCRLISEAMSMLVVNEATADATAAVLHAQLATVAAQCGDQHAAELALVVEGRSLQHALQAPLADTFLDLASRCRAKALIVELVKARTQAVLLAIGDGANDVGMIQAAHVGVGISGLEGLQAARSADIAIAQFRYLKRLLLVHGNWSYARLSKMILYSFYKTMTLYLTLFWFSFYSRFSGQTVYESWSQSFYNVVFTMMPALVIGIFDQYLSASMLERYPQLYGQSFFSGRDIGLWMLNAVYHSITNFFFVAYAFYGTTLGSAGHAGYQWIWGTTLFFSVLVTVLGKAAIVSNVWTRYTVAAIPGSFLVTLAFFVVFGTVAPSLGVSMEYANIVPRLLGLPRFWILIVFVPVLSLLRDLLWRFWQRTYTPKPYHIIQEMQKYRLQDAHPTAGQFQRNIRKVRTVQRLRRSRGYAFSQTEGEQAHLIRQYDTTKARPAGL
ncbi:P-type phospholipid transporter [Malassezia sp. CBS 17886]|nr:P-type phospholipid transporter [Malassezia sp. CBS 17886]